MENEEMTIDLGRIIKIMWERKKVTVGIVALYSDCNNRCFYAAQAV
jgi:hypothetical protein